MDSSCGRWSVVGETADGVRVAIPLRCRAWSCPRCGPFLKRRLIRKLSQTKSHAFMTLTANPAHYQTPLEAFSDMTEKVGLLFKRIKTRVAPAPVEYFLVWETTKRGWPHAHILLRAPYLPQRWLSNEWRDLAGSPIVDIRGVHNKRDAAHYIAKYLSKNPQVPPGYKRYRCSRHFFERLPPSDYLADFPRMTWRRSSLSADELRTLWTQEGLSVLVWWDGIVQAHTPIMGTPHRTGPPPLNSPAI